MSGYNIGYSYYKIFMFKSKTISTNRIFTSYNQLDVHIAFSIVNFQLVLKRL